MLKLSDIHKSYTVGGTTVEALRGIDLEFRENEFVSILGPSGCGKTTTLNIIGGLDRYSSGDLIINGRSTKEYRDSDWDAYRNHSVGFVFQSYNLIPHQTVLANVELALTLAGVSKAERRRRAKEALERVGLGDQLNKKPSQMSGGQMQRVAIARALINDPDILLADEPTGALDSETSIQVMELLREVAKDRLVIMVTHNPELAQRYSTRIITLKDGRVTGDSDPYHAEAAAPAVTGKGAKTGRHTSMSFLTALSLSLNNLMTKKGRTVLTSFAGSIGIIGIALILALSSGINAYISRVQEDTLSSYPITIEAESVDMSAMLTSLMGTKKEAEPERALDRVYTSTVMFDLMDSMFNAETVTNDLKSFKAWLEQDGNEIAQLAAIRYGYDFAFDIYNKDANGEIIKSDVMSLMEEAMTVMYGGDYSSYFSSFGSMYESMDVWEELMSGEDGALIAGQVTDNYDLLYGSWPERCDEVVLFVDESNEVSDLMLYALGLMSHSEMEDTLNALQNGEDVSEESRAWSYEELCGTTFKLILPSERYQYDAQTGTYADLSGTRAGLELLYNSGDIGTTLRVVGIARPNGDAAMGSGSMLAGSIGYTSALTDYAIEATAQSDVVREQMADSGTDVLLGLPFATGEEDEPAADEKERLIRDYLSGLDSQAKAEAYLDAMSQPAADYVEGVVDAQMDGLTRAGIEEMIVAQYAQEMGVDEATIASYIADMSDEQLFSQVEEAVAGQVREQYAQGVRARLETMSIGELSAMLDAALAAGDGDAAGMALTGEQYVYLYDNYMPATRSRSTYEKNLDLLGYVDPDSPAAISLYAATFADKDRVADLIGEYNSGLAEDERITYTDYVALLMSSITDIISGISYLLIAFVSISLVVSSIMIGIITHISVLERTKEIGILRAVGASKRDVSRVFNAETMIVGLGAGILGIAITLALIIPINAILLHFTGIEGLKASLPVAGGVVLVAISTLLTMLAGLIPARGAAKKDPVEALRSE